MRVRWTAGAYDDLQRITDYLFAENPTSAPDLIRRIYNGPARLQTFPQSGRPGRQPGTRELVLPDLPFILVYDLATDAVRILRVLHSARKWP